MFAQFSIYPMRTENISEDLARVIEVLEQTGLDYRMGPLGTAVEGPWDQVMDAIKKSHQCVAEHHDRVITSIVIDDRKDQPHNLAEMVTSVEEQLGRRIKK